MPTSVCIHPAEYCYASCSIYVDIQLLQFELSVNKDDDPFYLSYI